MGRGPKVEFSRQLFSVKIFIGGKDTLKLGTVKTNLPIERVTWLHGYIQALHL